MSAEQELEQMHLQFKQAEKTNAQLKTQLASLQEELFISQAKHQSTVASLSALKINESAAITLLQNQQSTTPSVSVQAFAHRVLQKYSVNEHAKLKIRKAGWINSYKRVRFQRSLKSNAKPRSRRIWTMKRMTVLLNDVGSHGEEVIIKLIRGLTKK